MSQALLNQFYQYFTHDALKTLVCTFVLALITVIHFSLGALQNLICKLQKDQNAAACLICHCARSDHIFSILSNPTFSTKLLFLPLNHWTIKPLLTSLNSSSCMFCLANSFIFHLLPQGKVPSSFKYHYSGTVYLTLSNTLHPQYHLNLPSMPCLCVCGCVPLVSCVCACVGSNEKAVEWSVVVCLSN